MTPEAQNLLDRLYIPYAERHLNGYFAWDGNTLYAEANDFFVIHDACHYLIADSDRRKLPDFGLGRGVAEYPPRDMDWFDAEMEEIQASILSSLYRLHLDQNPQEIQAWCNTVEGKLRFMNIDTMTLFWHNLMVLDERGLLNCHILNETRAHQRMLLMLEDSAYRVGRNVEEIREDYEQRKSS